MADETENVPAAEPASAEPAAAQEPPAKATPADEHDVELQDDEPDEPAESRADQFPAMTGTDEGLHAEVAQRSADGSDDELYRKTFVVDRPGVPDGDPIHAQNAAGVVSEAIQRGLHPKGDVRLVDTNVVDTSSGEPGSRVRVHTELTYAVPVVPASVDTVPESTVTPREVTDEADA